MLKNLAQKKWLGWAAGAGLTGFVGLMLLLFSPGRGLVHLSYDLPYILRYPVAVTNVAVIYIDRGSMEELNQTWPVDRKVHAELVKKLTAAGAKLIFFDVVFRKERPEDPELAAAIRAHGNVVLGGLYEATRRQSGGAAGAAIGENYPPIPILRTNARAWGYVLVRPIDYSFSSRRIFTGFHGTDTTDTDSAVWAAAKLEGAAITRQSGVAEGEYWLNFYGPTRTFSGVSFSQALAGGERPGLFQGAAVFIGADPSLTGQSEERDVFATPYSRFSRESRDKASSLMPGVEVLATAYSNLVRGEWLTRMATGTQALIIILWGFALGAGLHWLSPRMTLVAALGGAVMLAGVSIGLQIYGRIWWAWLIPAVAQSSVALGWAVFYRYVIESRQRQELRRAFSAYLSPHIAELVAAKNFNLELGGEETELTIMFTDLEGFTRMSETLQPKELSTILTTYFEKASREVLAQDGTIIKYIGDAVLAIWGAPIAAPDHAERAVRAALGIREAVQQRIFGYNLKTRIGINTGVTLVGNLGSSVRFDYTVVGANANYASRLEGLNKYFGTTICLSESTRNKLGDRIQVRCLGNILVQGTAQAAPVYELLGMANSAEPLPEWCATFHQAVAAFQKKDLETAQQLFRQVQQQRRGTDGPSKFYLDYMAALAKDQLDKGKEWTGVITMAEK